jgi:hypothetical protein
LGFEPARKYPGAEVGLSEFMTLDAAAFCLQPPSASALLEVRAESRQSTSSESDGGKQRSSKHKQSSSHAVSTFFFATTNKTYNKKLYFI